MSIHSSSGTLFEFICVCGFWVYEKEKEKEGEEERKTVINSTLYCQ